MAITEYVYSSDYPSNTKTVTVDLSRIIPVGEGGDEKYMIALSTSAYSNAASRTNISDIDIYSLKRGWAESSVVTVPMTLSGSTLELAIDEADSGAITITLPGGTYTGSDLASFIQGEISATASGTGIKVSATNRLSYLNAQVDFIDAKFRILSGSVNTSFNNTANWKKTSSVKVTGGTAQDALGFTTGYLNSFDLATTASGSLHQPASAVVTVDDAIRFGIASLINQIDFSA